MKSIRVSTVLLTFACLASMAVAAEAPAESLTTANPAAATAHVRLPIGQPAPEILATTPDGDAVSLAGLKGKPVVLQFGSVTEPLFRLRTPLVEKMATKYGDKVAFVIVYTRESHAADGSAPLDQNAQDGFDIAAPTSLEERVALAKQAVARLTIKKETMAVDAWSNTTALRYGNLPNMTFVIDADGILQAGYPWMDPRMVQGAVDALLNHKPVPDALRGPMHSSRGTDYHPVAMEMGGGGGGGGGGKLPMVIDHMKLSDSERAALMPALSQFLVDIRNYREMRTGVPAKGGAAPTTAPSGEKVRTVEVIQDDIAKVRASAQKLKDVCRQSLPADKAKQIIDAVDDGPARRLFADTK